MIGKSELVNTNKLVRNYQGCTGLKTGSTSLALYNLSASATRNNLSLIAVILRAPTTKDRFADAKTLLDYGFSTYSSASFGEAGDIISNVPVQKGVSKNVNAILSDTASVVIKKGMENEVCKEIKIDENLSAPIEKGQEIGMATFSINNEIISSVPIIAETEVKKSTFINITSETILNWFNLTRKI